MTATYVSGISTDEVRLFSNVSSTDIQNAYITDLKKYAAIQLNHDIGIIYKDWSVGSISTEKQNDTDGSNTVFYVNEWPLGDYDNDGEIGTGDVYAYSIASDGTRTEYTVSAINDASIGKFTLSTAPPSNQDLFFTWRYVPLDQTIPHPLIKQAILHLTNAYIQTRIEPANMQSWRVGKIAVTARTSAFDKFYSNYKRCITQILSEAVKRKEHPGFGTGFSYV